MVCTVASFMSSLTLSHGSATLLLVSGHWLVALTCRKHKWSVDGIQNNIFLLQSACRGLSRTSVASGEDAVTDHTTAAASLLGYLHWA